MSQKSNAKSQNYTYNPIEVYQKAFGIFTRDKLELVLKRTGCSYTQLATHMTLDVAGDICACYNSKDTSVLDNKWKELSGEMSASLETFDDCVKTYPLVHESSQNDVIAAVLLLIKKIDLSTDNFKNIILPRVNKFTKAIGRNNKKSLQVFLRGILKYLTGDEKNSVPDNNMIHSLTNGDCGTFLQYSDTVAEIIVEHIVSELEQNATNRVIQMNKNVAQ